MNLLPAFETRVPVLDPEDRTFCLVALSQLDRPFMTFHRPPP